MNRLLSIAVLLVCATSCKGLLSDGETFSGDGGNEVKGKANAPQGATATPSGTKSVIEGKYRLRVALSDDANSDGGLCKGIVNLHIKDDFSLTFPTSKAKCIGMGDIDLEKLLGAMASEKKANVESTGKLLKVDRMGNTSFSPARPLLVGPIAQDMESFKGFVDTNTYSAILEDEVKKEKKEGTGTITVTILEVGITRSPKLMPGTTHDNILTWHMKTEGFDSLPRSQGFLFDHVFFSLNTRPIAIPRIMIASKAKHLLEGAGEGGGLPTSGIFASLDKSFLGKIVKSAIMNQTLYIHLDAESFQTK